MRQTMLITVLAVLCVTSSLAQAGSPDLDLSGKMYFDVTHIDQKDSDHGSTDSSGLGLDVKRFYLTVAAKFDDVWSANLTTDFNYVRNDGQTNLLIKKAYVQGNFSKSLVLRIGSAGMPWTPFVDSYYGFRYVEKSLVDRLKYGNSADWGLHLGGDINDSGSLNYAISAVNGGGYKHPSRSKGMDMEARIGFAPFLGMVVALGGYSGKRGSDVRSADTFHTATRSDLMVAYAKDGIRVGAEYFSASNWNTVLTPLSDKAAGYSVWGSLDVGEQSTVFARYDKTDTSKNIDLNARDTYFNLGVQYQINGKFKLAAVFKHEERERGVDTPAPMHVANLRTNEIGVWGEFKF